MILDRLAEELQELAIIEQRPNLDGRNMTMMLGPSKAVLAGTLDGGSDEELAEGDAPAEATEAEATVDTTAEADAPEAEEADDTSDAEADEPEADEPEADEPDAAPADEPEDDAPEAEPAADGETPAAS
jgi:translation initiation factor IF-3